MKGATPLGTRNEQEAANWVRGMFGRVAHRYDLANHLLSLNIDRIWRARTVRRVRHILERPDARVLDICCGTGDLVLALAGKVRHGRPVLGSDFCHPMLTAAHDKVAKRGGRAVLFEADALRLPVRDSSLDLDHGGLRILQPGELIRVGLREIRRALNPGGTAAILEFSQPPNRIFATLQADQLVLPAGFCL